MIVLDNVNFRWQPDAAPVLSIARLEIGENSEVFLHGPSGSGKSTLLSLLAGINRAEQGTVTVLGQDLGALSGAARDQFRADHIGYIFQQFNLLPYLNALENVTLGCQFSRLRSRQATRRDGSVEKSAIRLLGELGLDPSLHRQPVSQLSIGQQQRVAAARAFIGEPELIIADEPTSALDASSRAAFIELLFKQVAGSSASLVFVSHDESLEKLFSLSLSLKALQGAAR